MPTYHTRLTPHFIAGELGADRAPAQYLPNIQRTADYLEVIREILGVPLGKVSGWRSPARNEQVGGSSSSSHLDGLAADFQPMGKSVWDSYNELKQARSNGRLPAFDQIILYPFQHLHVGLGSRMRGEFRIKVYETGRFALDTSTPPPTPTLVDNNLTTGQADFVAVLAIGFVTLVVLIAILA